jgi:hypothetical protein
MTDVSSACGSWYSSDSSPQLTLQAYPNAGSLRRGCPCPAYPSALVRGITKGLETPAREIARELMEGLSSTFHWPSGEVAF